MANYAGLKGLPAFCIPNTSDLTWKSADLREDYAAADAIREKVQEGSSPCSSRSSEL